MKKLIVLAAVLMAWIGRSQIIYQGNSLINAQVGFGLTNHVSMSNGAGMDFKLKTVIPPVGLSYEYAIKDNITVGGFADYAVQQGIMKMTDPFNPGDEVKITTDYNYIFLGALANYHFNLNIDKVDVYGGIKLGYLAFSSQTTSSGDSDLPANLGTTDMSGLIYGFQLGGRYFFTDHLAAHLHLGYGVSYVSFGITYKLGY